MSEITLSLCMIVRNEEQDLAACLTEIQPIVDEIVILDTGSGDRTVEIARSHGARVFDGEWRGDFALARNTALRHCRGRWVLSLDADERLDYLNGHRLLRAIRLAGEDVLALALVIESEVCRQGGEILARHVFPRVFRRDPAIRWTGALHEQLVHDTLNLLERTRLTDVVVRHLGYAREERHRERSSRNAEVLERTSEDASTPFQRLSAAHSLMNFGRHDEAAAELRALIDEGLPTNLDSTARWSLAAALMERRRHAEARRVLEEARGRHPHHVAFRYLLAEVYLGEGRSLEARALYDELLGEPQPLVDARTDLIPTRATLEIQRARTFLAAGRPVEALRQIEAVLRREPGHSEGRFQQACALDALGRAAEAASILEALAEELPGVGAVRQKLAALSGRAERRHRPGLAVCVIAKDEAQNLAALLPTLSGLADEIIVVDTGSADATREVARRHGARVVRHPWADDFAAARNAGLEAVTHRWVLWLDADERLPEAHREEILGWTKREDVDGVTLFLESAHTSSDPVERSRGRYCRLFRADIGARFEGRVHEQILPALQRRGARVVDSAIVIEHHGYASDPQVMRAKKLRNLRLLELSHRDDPNDFYTLFQIGTTRAALGDFAGAIGPLDRALETGRDEMTPEIRLWTHTRLAQAAFALGDLDRCETHARRALREAPDLQMGHYLLSAVWLRRGRPARSAVCLRRILRGTVPDPVAPLRKEEVEREFLRVSSQIPRASAAAPSQS